MRGIKIEVVSYHEHETFATKDYARQHIIEITKNLPHCQNATSYNGTKNKECVFCEKGTTHKTSILHEKQETDFQ